VAGRRRRRTAIIDPDMRAVIEEMQRSLGTRVRLLPKVRSNKGKIEIEYYSLPDLERIVQKITGSQARAQ
jgi:ParB family chromosome partitioning protein